jgi:outer membrane cobalamin receptor
MNKSLLTVGMCVAFLQMNAQTDTLNTVQVEAEKIINPSKTSKTLNFTEGQMNELSQRSVADLLARASSVYIKSYGLGALATPSVRGTGASQTQVFWNGVNINSPTLGQSDLALLPNIFFNQAQLHLGSTSTVDGSGGIGGSIRLNNETHYKNGERVMFVQEFGSFGLNTTGLNIGVGNGKVQSNTTFYKGEAKNDYMYTDLSVPEKPRVRQTNNALNQIGLGQDVSYKFNRNEIEFKSLVFSSFRELPSGYGFVNDATQTDKSQKFLLAFNRLQNKSSHTLKVALVNDDMVYNSPSWNYTSSYVTQSLSSIYNGVYHFNNFKLKTFLLNQSDRAESDEFSELKIRNKSAAYIMAEHQVTDNVLYHVSIRQEYIDEVVAPIAPSVGVKYSIKEAHHIALNAAKTFRAPSLNDLYWNWGGNPDLLPENAYTTELNYNFTKKKFNYTATVFYSMVDNWIQWAPTEFGFWIPQNIKTVRNMGFESHLNAPVYSTPTTKLDVNVNYTYVQSTNMSSAMADDIAVGKQLIYVPNHTFNVNAMLAYKKFTFNYFQTLTSKVYTDALNENHIAGFIPADASLYYTFKTVSAGVRVQNIFNEQYQVIQGYPMPGRNVQVLVRFLLDK